MTGAARPTQGKLRGAVAAALLLAAGVAQGAPAFRPHTGRLEPTLASLHEAASREDRGELARAAARFGFARLADVLVAARGGHARAADAKLALVVAAELPGAARLLPDAVPLLANGDGDVATAAARALAAMLGGADPAALADWDVPPDAVRAACAALLVQARDAGRPTEIRVAAIEALAAAPACPNPAAALVEDRDAAIRRAAAVALPARANVAPLRPLLADADASVAAAAAARLCGGLAPAARPDGELVGVARRLVGDAAVAPEDAVDLLGCLAASGDGNDRRALEKLRDGGAPALRRRAAELLTK